jgi:prepilin-type N-terminal cleavage/methylation domain-containing protein
MPQSTLKRFKSRYQPFLESSGFTLIEVLIAIVIISLIGITFFPNLRKFNSDQQYLADVQNIKNDIKKTQNMFTTGIRCSSTKAAISWSVVLTVGTNIVTNLRADCITSAQVRSFDNLTADTKTNISVLSSTCGSNATSIELRFDKTGFSYACNGTNSFTSGTFSLQLQNKNNTSQNTTISINKSGTISQN